MEASNKTKISGSVVVLGTMNPKIHHPSWYLREEILTKEEADQATSEAELICTDQVSQFQTNTLRIFCTQDRWIAEFKKSPFEDSLIKIVGDVFDKCLPHTPLNALGFNYDLNCQCPAVNVDETLGQILSDQRLGLSDFNAVSGRVHLKSEEVGREVNIDLSGSALGKEWLLVHVNFHYDDIEPLKFGTHAKEHVSKDMEKAHAIAQKCTSAFIHSQEKT